MAASVSTKVKQILGNVLDLALDPESIDDQLRLYSTTISLNSVTALQLLAELERAFSCEIDDEAVMTGGLIDVGSLVNLVLSQPGGSRLPVWLSGR